MTKRTELDKKIDHDFVIFQQGMDMLHILGKVQKKFPETKEFIDKELQKSSDNFKKHVGLHETGKVGSWIKLEFDNE